MMQLKRITYILLLVTAPLLFAACEHKELEPCQPEGNIPVQVVIHWDNVPANQLVLPSGMTVHWYPKSGSLLSSDMGVFGGFEKLNANIYRTMCLDFNGNSRLGFRSSGSIEDFEIYNIRMNSSYNTNVPQLPGGETTVAEAYPYRFYMDSQPQTVDIREASPKDTATVHFYPKDVLREFTFLVYDVKGARHMTQNSGAISGMSGSYFPANNRLAVAASTILFQRVEAIRDGQADSRWTNEQKRLFALKNPNWASSDTLVGWTRDWVTGQFVTFGPLNRNEHRFRLTVEALNHGNNHYHGAWGYWHGQWENTVAAQIDSAMGKNGTREEQLAWRQRNGGYDIILYNDNRLVVPDGGSTGSVPDGGFQVNVDDWGEIINVPVAGSGASPAPKQKSPALRSSPINTYATIPEFVVNGVWTGSKPWYHIFNEQHVYKPEAGKGLVWDYAPKKYWPEDGKVDFYAYAPGGLPAANLLRGLYDNGDENNAPVLKYILSRKEREEPPHGTGEPPSPQLVGDSQQDLLVAVQQRSSPQTSAVPMNFKHAFSRVDIKARSGAASGYRIKLTRIDLRGLYIQGELQLNPDTSDPTDPSNGIPMEADKKFKYDDSGAAKLILWKNWETLCDYRPRLISPEVTIESLNTNLLRNEDRVLVIPQKKDVEIYVEYDVYQLNQWGDETFEEAKSKTFPLSQFSFEIGRQYEFQLTLNYPNQ